VTGYNKLDPQDFGSDALVGRVGTGIGTLKPLNMQPAHEKKKVHTPICPRVRIRG
jgi:hypothetical protein